MQPSLLRLQPKAPVIATPPSLGTQVVQLERDRDEAKREAAALKTEVLRLNQARRDSERSRAELEKKLDIANKAQRLQRERRERRMKRATVHKQQLEKVKSVARGAMHEARMLRSKGKATGKAVEAVDQFLSKNKEITGDSFFGIGRKFDDLRASIAEIPETDSNTATNEAGLKRRVGYMDGKVFVVFGDLEGAKAGSGQRAESSQEKASSLLGNGSMIMGEANGETQAIATDGVEERSSVM
ncbi:hypothetical protein M409DRAFT_24951 [Zasmidium cellare ATCC 36951]|uniref:Uncharacterized protein n=1 Tax=Zasmidium cellare ATCC 36951 TaxID=1080233 RepID=A0A6A6CC02_ZASCE|nr:uncharacterized protein M409DRAFT_24951 [Zasmidium cellare ATCC 36951]KAF2164551.1 hypothetical protein M409DRAFT_24951 [Zasmidium cellare ATCC 36951]